MQVQAYFVSLSCHVRLPRNHLGTGCQMEAAARGPKQGDSWCRDMVWYAIINRTLIPDSCYQAVYTFCKALHGTLFPRLLLGRLQDWRQAV